MKVITYTLTLEQPLLATQLLGDPNSSVSFPYVPGALMRGLLVARYRSANAVSAAALTDDPTAWRLFFGGETRFLHAYPQLDEQRSLPAPLSLHRYKGQKEGRLFNFASSQWNAEQRRARELPDDPFVPFAKEGVFCRIVGGHMTRSPSSLAQIAVHVQRDRRMGRATAESGAVFRYEALPAGSLFRGAILVDHETDAAQLAGLLAEPTAWLGRSRSAGYGRVRVDHTIESGALPWNECGVDAQALKAGQPVLLTLLSDTILRSGEGMPLTQADDASLSRYLGATVQIDAARSYSASALVGGFSRAWELPLPQTNALRAGSVLMITPHEAVEASVVDRWLWEGIGERRAEGFGRVAVGWCDALELSQSEHKDAPADRHPPTLTSASRSVAQQVVNRIYRQRAEAAIISFLHTHRLDDAEWVRNWPKGSQIGRVRMLVRRALIDDNLPPVRRALEELKPAGRDQFEVVRIDQTPLLSWVINLLDAPTSVWYYLKIHEPTIGDVTPDRAKLAPHYALKLIDAVLSAPARARRKEELR